MGVACGSSPWEQAFITPRSALSHKRTQVARLAVASSGTSSGCCKVGIWEDGFLKEAPEGFAAGTEAKFGLSSFCCDECDF